MVNCEFCGVRMTSAPSHMDHLDECYGNPKNQAKVAIEALRSVLRTRSLEAAKAVAKAALLVVDVKPKN